MTKEEEKPPILKNWNTLYGIVIAFLFVLILLFYLLTTAVS